MPEWRERLTLNHDLETLISFPAHSNFTHVYEDDCDVTEMSPGTITHVTEIRSVCFGVPCQTSAT